MAGKDGRMREGDWRGPGWALLVFVLSACASGGPSSVALPEGVDPGVVATQAAAQTHPASPAKITFRFRVREADFRFQGMGVARVDPEYRVRLDLFSNQGETLFQAALVGSELRIPVWAPRELAPPPALLWAALGIFRPDADLDFLGGRGHPEGGVILRYGEPQRLELRFRILEGHLTRAELYRSGHLSEEVDLRLGEDPEGVVETVYRNRAEFMEMTFSLETTESVEAFPPHIWYPGQ